MRRARRRRKSVIKNRLEYRNTVTVNWISSNPVQPFITASELYNLPNRNIVPTKVMIQIMPTLTNSGGPAVSASVMKFQPALNAKSQNNAIGYALPFGPFRILSNINPTWYMCNINKLSNVAKNVQVAIPGNSTDPQEWSIELNILPFQFEPPREVELVITGFCKILPMELLSIVTLDKTQPPLKSRKDEILEKLKLLAVDDTEAKQKEMDEEEWDIIKTWPKGSRDRYLHYLRYLANPDEQDGDLQRKG